MVFNIEELKNKRILFQDTEQGMKFTYLGVGFSAGSRFDPPELAGASHLLEHLVFKGTQQKTAEEINREFNKLGAYSNAFTSWNTVFYFSKVPTDNLEKTAELWAELLESLVFTEEDFENEKQVVLEELRMRDDSPVQSLSKQLLKKFLPDHSIGRPIGGEEKTVANITKDQLENFMREYYTAEGSLLLLAGGEPDEKTLQKIKDIFGSNHSQERKVPKVPNDEPINPKKGIYYFNRRSKTIYGELLAIGPPGNTVLGKAMKLFTYYLTESKRSPLYKALIRKGLVSDFGSVLYVQPDISVWGIGFSASKEKFSSSLNTILTTIKEVLSKPWDEETLSSWVKEYNARLSIGSESVSFRAMFDLEMYYDFALQGNYEALISLNNQLVTEDISELFNLLKKELPFALGILGPKKSVNLIDNDLLPN